MAGVTRMKRIIDGKAYNTATSALLYTVEDESGLYFAELYRTRHGVYFLCVGDLNDGSGHLKPLTDEEARKWLEGHNADDVIDEHFGPFPEAGAAESRVTLRLPGNLYRRVSASAAAANVSLNTYLMRLLERSESHTAVEDR